MQITIKQRIDGVWKPVPLQHSTPYQIMLDLEGKDAVAEIEDAGKKIYLCGNLTWVTTYRNKGYRAGTFAQGIDQLKAKGKDALLYVEQPDVVKESCRIMGGNIESISDEFQNNSAECDRGGYKGSISGKGYSV